MLTLRNTLLAAMAYAVLALNPTTAIISTADAAVIGGRPAGCPARYCGCAVARKVGLTGANWNVNLAANYLGLPRASCAPGMVAARRGHVFVIQACHGNGTVTAYDPNSGGGKTRIWTRSLRGYAIVNPRGGNAYARARTGKRYARARQAQPVQVFAWWKPNPHHAVPRSQYRQRKKAKVRSQQARRYTQPRTRYARAR